MKIEDFADISDCLRGGIFILLLRRSRVYWQSLAGDAGDYLKPSLEESAIVDAADYLRPSL